MYKYKVILELNLDNNKYPDWVIESINNQLNDCEEILKYSLVRIEEGENNDCACSAFIKQL